MNRNEKAAFYEEESKYLDFERENRNPPAGRGLRFWIWVF
jgi:hypothetical protein